MKAKTGLFTVIVLLFLAGAGCEKEEKAKIITPISNISKQVKSFFETQLPITKESECFFKSNKGNVHYLINSMKELESVFSCERELPEIDFNRYTIIIGQERMPNSYYSVSNQSITESKTLELVISAALLSDGSWPALSTMYYWGIYPKLSNKALNVKVVIKLKKQIWHESKNNFIYSNCPAVFGRRRGV